MTTTNMNRRYFRYLTGISLCLLFILLLGCGGPLTTGGEKTNKSSTPVVIPKGTTTDGNWTMYHHDSTHTGYISNAPDPQQLVQAWNMQLDGAVYGQPLVVGKQLLVATEGNSLYSLNMDTGQIQWHTNVGTPVPLSSLPCGNIDPLGITGTPIYDQATGLLFAVAEVQGFSHILVGVDITSGKIKFRRQVDPPSGDIRAHQQRAALALYKDKVYITYGGLDGDCGNYHGWVVASQTNGQGKLLGYQVPVTREGGIWTPPGPVIDGNGNIFVSVGNGSETQGDWDHSDSVLHLSSDLKLQDGFAPDQWREDNDADADLGSVSPSLLSNGWIFMVGKSSKGYVLHANNLGGVGGQNDTKQVCKAYGGTAIVDTHVFVPCIDGIQEVSIDQAGHISLGWKSSAAVIGSPIVGGHTLYSINHNSGTLYALNLDNGTTRTSLDIGVTSRFATPTLSHGMLFIGTMTGVVAVKIA